MGKPFRKTKAQILRDYERTLALSKIAPEGKTSLVLVLDGLKPSFNIGKIYRSAAAFGVSSVILVGIGPFDPAPAKGTMKQIRTRCFETVGAALDELRAEGYQCFALDPKAQLCLDQVQLPKKTAFILGHEQFGLTPLVRSDLLVAPIRIRQQGQVESLNVSIAASIAMYEYARQVTHANRSGQ